MNKFAAAAALALVATASNAQPPRPITGDGVLLFAAWDANQSYTFDLGETFLSFDPNVGQAFTLTDFAGFFTGDFRWNIVAADQSQVPGEGIETIGILSTGELTGGFNDGAMSTATGAVDQYIQAVIQACGSDPVCTATADQLHYANRAGAFPYGDNLFPGQWLSGIDSTASEAQFFFAEQNGTGFFPIEEEVLPFTWTLDGDVLTYGEVTVIPVPAAFWLLLTGVAGLAGIRRTRA